MIKKTVSKHSLRDPSSGQVDLNYWLSRPPQERIAAVEHLRRQLYGSSIRFQRIARVIKRSQS